MTRRPPTGIGAGAWAAGLALYAATLVAIAPATLLDAGLSHATQGRLRVAEARGSIWSGAGRLEVRGPEGRGGIGEPIAWRARPASLLRGKLEYDVRPEQSARAFRLAVSPRAAEFTDADVTLPAAVLGLAVPQLAALGLDGELTLRVASLSVGRDGVLGNATLQWHGVRSVLVPVFPLGAYEFRMEASGGGGQVRLRTLEGPLQLDGEGSWAKDRPPALIATARMPPELREQLAPLLRLTAVERGDGSFELNLARYPLAPPAGR